MNRPENSASEQIKSAIFHAARAGGCRRAARYDVASAEVWRLVADAEGKKANAALAQYLATASVDEPPPESWDEAARWCQRRSDRLSAWQRNFIDGLCLRYLRDHEGPTGWQQKRLMSIYQQLDAQEGQP